MAALKEQLKQMALDSGVDFFGVASVDRFVNAPEGHKPTDLLPGAKSTISMGVKIGEGVRTANDRAYAGIRHGIYIYQVFGYQYINDVLNRAAYGLSRFLERAGYPTTPIPAAAPNDPLQLMGAMSHRHAAVAAGLGEFAWNNLLITQEAGPRVRLVTVITEAELEPDPLYQGAAICTGDACGICIDRCPTNAFDPTQEVGVVIGGKEFFYKRLKKTRCRFGVSGLIKAALGRQDCPLPEEPTPEDYLQALRQESPWQRPERIASMCGRCIIQCPVGS